MTSPSCQVLMLSRNSFKTLPSCDLKDHKT
ncbi:hypothetical protein OOU_Y34scaffold00979g5 [Pyricularia oryzae Y34]|uniref:Uncharacterized protein n=2 Tax=Pyricularia oryzae TaxID=318829 RepID=A0AA97NN59_PYRO3|nr:hypothetical protein OOU_Y34scaffold00979g5 [Pyricularia oryzae Y34]